MGSPGCILNIVLWFPMISGLFLLLFNTQSNCAGKMKWMALVSSLITFLLTLDLLFYFDFSLSGIQPLLSYTVPWIKAFHINYNLGVDGISYSMIFLNNLLFPICVLCSWNIEKNPKAFFSLMLILQSTILGVFTSLDFL